MIATIIIFFIAIITLFGMMMYRAWEIQTSRVEKPDSDKKIFPKIYFRHVEQVALYLIKRGVQWIVLVVVKYWFIVTTKIRKWAAKNLPKIFEFFRKKTKDLDQQKKSFIRRAVLESKTKIRHIREKVRREHEE